MLHPLAADLDHVLEQTPALSDIRGQSIFLTGGTGFVGTWLVESFAWANDKLNLGTSITVLTRDAASYRRKAPRLTGNAAIRLIEGDVTDFDFPAGEYQIVIHAATERYGEPSAERPLSTFDCDIQGTRRVLEFARARKTRRLLFTSSGAAYGPQPSDFSHLPETYSGAPAVNDTNSAYGHAKRVSEWQSVMYARQFGFTAVIARLFAFVGPHLPLDANFAVGNFIRDALRGGPVRISGDGTPFRSYLYAADLARWLWTMLLRGESGRIYNVGSAEAINIADLARSVAAVVSPGTPVEIAHQAVPGARAARYVPDVTRAERELGLRPAISLAEGVRRTAEWYRSECPAVITSLV
jgi:dTDP-glucose 4,6-dehydratase